MKKTENLGPQFTQKSKGRKQTKNRLSYKTNKDRWLGLGKWGRPNDTAEPGQ
jgi:hypothetical protein